MIKIADGGLHVVSLLSAKPLRPTGAATVAVAPARGIAKHVL